MSNAWVDHIKAFAEKNKVPYACALVNPACRASYKPAVKTNKPSAQRLLDEVSQEVDINDDDFEEMEIDLEKKLKRMSPQKAIYAVLKKFGYIDD